MGAAFACVATNAQLSLEAATDLRKRPVARFGSLFGTGNTGGGSATGIGECERAIALSSALAKSLPVISPVCKVKQRRPNEVASHRTSMTGAPVQPIQIDHRWRDSDANSLQPLRIGFFVAVAGRD
jgi:hypothetical protein